MLNFLEQLAAEWYEYSGYFVRTNVRTRKRAKGGWDIELDVLAYQPSEKFLVHIETSGDADSWKERKARFLTKKFILSKSEYEEILGADLEGIQKIAIVGWSKSPKADLEWGSDVEVMTVPIFLEQIIKKLQGQSFMSESVPEGYPILRTVQMLLEYGIPAA
ncbi:MAG: hypothetical protein P1P76_12520 [Anaerolineales bacterium]|nr:hypothetical protein [Anaerolineales bacterium]